MFSATVLRRFAALCCALAYAPTHAFESSSMNTVPLNIVLSKECGTEKNQSLSAFANRELIWCGFNSTVLMAGTTDIQALRGRRLYVDIDFAPSPKHGFPLTLTMSSFSEDGQVKTHLGAAYQTWGGRVTTSLYVPSDATSVYWVLTGGPPEQQPYSVVIQNASARASASTFRPGDMCNVCHSYLNHTLKRVADEFLFAESLGLDELSSALRLAATGAQGIEDMHGPMKELARKIAEATVAKGVNPHGSYQTKAEYDATVSSASADNMQVASLFTTRLLASRTGYVQLRSYTQPDLRDGQIYARALRRELVSLRARGADRWVIDLRHHRGGTLFPAIAALRPLLGKQAAGYFTDATGKQQQAWLWGTTQSGTEQDPYITAPDQQFEAEQDPTAVLLGAETASTGEMLAIAFMGRPAARSFGAPTAGFTTVVSGKPDSYGNFLGIIAAYAADRNGEKVFPRVQPDVVIDQVQPKSAVSDAALNAATRWLEEEQ